MRPILSAAVERWGGWEHGLFAFLIGIAVALFLKGSRAEPRETTKPGRRHVQVRDPRVDPAFQRAASTYAAFIDSGAAADAVEARLARVLEDAGYAEEEARAVAHAHVVSGGRGRRRRTQEAREAAIIETLKIADDAARGGGAPARPKGFATET